MKILVTGASGNIGHPLINRLLSLGFSVRALLYRRNNFDAISKLEITPGDISNSKSLRAAMKDVNAVIHLAAFVSFNRRHIPRLKQINVEGTANCCHTALEMGIKRFLYVSAGAACGLSASPDIPLNETSPSPSWKDDPYGASKAQAEEKVRQAVFSGLQAVIANPATVYGRSIGALKRSNVLDSSLLTWAPPGGTSWISMEDCINGLLAVFEKGRPGERYILSAGNTLYVDLLKVLHGKDPAFVLPFWSQPLARASAMILESVTKNTLITEALAKASFNFRYLDSTKARQELGWNPKINTISEALENISPIGPLPPDPSRLIKKIEASS